MKYATCPHPSCGRRVRVHQTAAPPGPPVEVFVPHLLPATGAGAQLSMVWCDQGGQTVPAQLVLDADRPARVDIDG